MNDSPDFVEAVDKPMSEDQMSVKGLQRDIDKFNTEKQRDAILAVIAKNNKTRDIHLQQKAEDERVKIKIAKWKETLNSNIIQNPNSKTDSEELVKTTTTG